MPKKHLVVVHGVQAGDNQSAVEGPKELGAAVTAWVDGAFGVALTTPAYEDLMDATERAFLRISKQIVAFLDSPIAANALDKVADLVADVFVYRDTDRGQDIRNVVRQAVDANPNCVLVGHSLGSVVCFDLIAEMAGEGRFQGERPDWPVSAFVTIGSPLALGLFADDRELAPLGGAKPLRWYNYYDPHDPVVSQRIFGTELPVTDPIRERYGAHPDWKIVDYAVNTGKHLVSHINYWDQPDVVARVAGLLERSKG